MSQHITVWLIWYNSSKPTLNRGSVTTSKKPTWLLLTPGFSRSNSGLHGRLAAFSWSPCLQNSSSKQRTHLKPEASATAKTCAFHSIIFLAAHDPLPKGWEGWPGKGHSLDLHRQNAQACILSHSGSKVYNAQACIDTTRVKGVVVKLDGQCNPSHLMWTSKFSATCPRSALFRATWSKSSCCSGLNFDRSMPWSCENGDTHPCLTLHTLPERALEVYLGCPSDTSNKQTKQKWCTSVKAAPIQKGQQQVQAPPRVQVEL